MISKCKLPLSFEPVHLRQDLEQIKPESWIPHFNRTYFEGEWSGVALRSIGGVPDQIYPDPNPSGDYQDTEILQRCRHLRDALSVFKCPVLSARLLKLAAGAVIKEHRDLNLGPEDGEIRLHVPISTNPQVEFFLDAEQVEMNEGECWYLNFNLPHWVKNNGATDRIHLVVDCVLDEWLKHLLYEAMGPQSNGQESTDVLRSSPEEFERFRKFVLTDPSVQKRLRQTGDRQSFARLAARIGEEHGYLFGQDDVKNAIRESRSVWVKRWIE